MKDFKKVFSAFVASMKNNDANPNPVEIYEVFEEISKLEEKEVCSVYSMAHSIEDRAAPEKMSSVFPVQLKKAAIARMEELVAAAKAKGAVEKMKKKFFTITNNEAFEE